MSKRKAEDLEPAEGPSQQRRRKRSSSEPPLPNETEEPEKREVLRRLFGRYCTINIGNNRPAEEEVLSDSDLEECESLDENDDPLLDSVPVNMDPETLGFLVCAQETLRFLHGRGFTIENPMFMRLRSRLLKGIQDIAAA